MLVKTKDVKGNRPVYINTITGKSGTLSEHTFIPSQRRHKRHISSKVQKVTTNRKSTKGRHTYFQTVDIKIDGKPTGLKKTIKHIQETFDAIQRKILMLKLYDNIYAAKRA